MPPQSKPSLAARLRGVGTTTRISGAVLWRQGCSQFYFWLMALVIGILAGFTAVGFRKGTTALQGWVYGADDIHYLHSFAATMPWYMLILIPLLGGLAVGVILHNFTADARVRSVSDVIEGSALREGRVEIREGLASACASFLTLSTGGSSGREGPVVHLAGVISTWATDRIKFDAVKSRDLLGCAVAAAVSASFNAPIAGALFAMEVVLRHFAVNAFAPIVIAAVAGTVINRLEFGDVTEFKLSTPGALQFYVELPAFLIMGLVCGIVAVILMRTIFWADSTGTRVQNGLHLPRWLRPGIAGLLLGLIAVWFPHIIGVGYETTVRALSGELGLSEVMIFVIIKIIAVAITMGGRMGGGVFSPALMIGAMTGLAFGVVATSLFPEVSGTETLYAFAGMGAVAAAVLGAPISTTLIVFELTGDWQIGIAVMVAVSTSTALASRLVDRSFFLTQLENRNIRCAAGPQAYLLGSLAARTVMRPLASLSLDEQDALIQLYHQDVYASSSAYLESVLPIFERHNLEVIPVVDSNAVDNLVVGSISHLACLKSYNRALVAVAAEEHR